MPTVKIIVNPAYALPILPNSNSTLSALCRERRLSMLLPVAPATAVFAAIGPSKCPLAILLIVFILAIVLATVGP